MFDGVNFLAVVIAVISSWLLGGIWYSKRVFGSIYMADEKHKKMDDRHPAVVFVIAFVLWFITATAFASALGPNPQLGFAVLIGLMTGTFFVATSFGVNYAYTGKSWKIFLIDAGYHVVQFMLYGVIFAGWHMI